MQHHIFFEVPWFLLSFVVAFYDQILILQMCVFLFSDGIRICRESCIYCSVGCICFIVHGTAWFFYTKVVDSWGSWDSIAYSCWSWGNLTICFAFLSASKWGFIPFLYFIWMFSQVVGLILLLLSCFLFFFSVWVECLCATWISATYIFYFLGACSDTYELPLKHNDPCNKALCSKWLDTDKDTGLWRLWYSGGKS